MSNMERAPDVRWSGDGSATAVAPVHDEIPAREVSLGGDTVVRRMLPRAKRRLIGAWCLADHYGPDDVAGRDGMLVPPHPHTGLQTVTWLLDGELHHRDSLGTVQTIRPGQLNLMTAGHGIAHSEESPKPHPPVLHGVQLWIALPLEAADTDPAFEHHAVLPRVNIGGAEITVIAGHAAGAESPATLHSPLVALDVQVEKESRATLLLRPEFEHGVLVLDGWLEVDRVPLHPGTLLYLGSERARLDLRSSGAGRLLLLGGAPFEEELVMWWNFVAHSGAEITQARDDWEAGRRFGEVHGFDGDRLAAPALPAVTLKPRR